MAREVIDTLLDGEGRVVTNAKLAHTMRRVVLVDGKVVETAIYINERYTNAVTGEPTQNAKQQAAKKGWY